MRESDTERRWWLRVTEGREFPVRQPPAPLSFDQIVFGAIKAPIDDRQEQE